jgi:serine O-acetyltransferase
MFKLILQDLEQFAHGVTRRDKVKVLIMSSGFFAVVLIRLQSYFFENHRLTLSYITHRINLNLHGIDVSPGAKIAGGLRIEHPVGIVIGSGCVIGTNCTIMQGVTIGVKNVSRISNDNRYPIIGCNVIIGVNSSILGGISIGDDVRIGAHVLIRKNCASGSRWASFNHSKEIDRAEKND